MKIFVIILLFVAIGCYADDTTDITNKVFEKKDKDGKVSFRLERIYRGKDMVMMESFRPNAQGVLVLGTRSYWVGGDLVMMESDDHKSGKLDTVVVYNPGKDDMEVFTRQADGSVKPVSARTLQAYKQQNAAVSDFVRTTLTGTNMSDAELSERIQETQQKIQDAEKQKTDSKQ
jgi:hypothetical protein